MDASTTTLKSSSVNPRRRKQVLAAIMALPSLSFLLIFMALPAAILLSYSLMTQSDNGSIGLPLTLEHYRRLFAGGTYLGIFYQTLFIAVATSLLSILMAYPLALTITNGSKLMSRITIILVVAPLMVSVIVRTYGWQILLSNGPQGGLNFLLHQLGITSLITLLNTKWAVIIASAHVFLPLLVLPLASSLARIKPGYLEAAQMLGATSLMAFLRITLPLSLPGLMAGVTIVFTLTSASYITPAMIGGPDGMMLGVLLEQQINTVYDWPMGATIGFIMVAIALAGHIGGNALTRRFASTTSATPRVVSRKLPAGDSA
ncbi:putative spermidine/putrescine transport system permease protein [Erwinia toletana]|uniref:Spermidine/putrescine transport system permease protein n=1 Tax=Winslowiella toletana TaxID=92490 RepID=A0ABS4P3V5_9GAMM|nr:ABC transporter permease [Winslowiella toletana]MBP2166822.1 putative spermidine/putrescine transport system permease protein [Winslowiella toletana]